MLGSAGTFTLSRQREFTQREFHTARVSRSAGTVARCSTAERTARVDTDTSPVGATGAATRRSHRRAQKTCAHAEGGTEGGTEAVPGHVGGERVCRTARGFEFVFEFVLSQAVSLGRSVSSGPAGV